jgi:hypothetical protein
VYYFFAKRLGHSVLWRPIASPLASLGVVAMLSAPLVVAVLAEIATSLDDGEADRLEDLLDRLEEDDLTVSLSWNISLGISGEADDSDGGKQHVLHAVADMQRLRMLLAEPVEEELFFRYVCARVLVRVRACVCGWCVRAYVVGA